MAQEHSTTTVPVLASAKVITTICNGVPELGWDIVERIRDDEPTLQFFRRQDQDRIDKWANPGMESVTAIVGYLSPEAVRGHEVHITKHPEAKMPDCDEIVFPSVEKFLKSGYDLKFKRCGSKGKKKLVLVEP